MAKLSSGKRKNFGLLPTVEPTSPREGDVYYNDADDSILFYNGTQWGALNNQNSATGGTETSSGGYGIHTFLTSSTFTPTAAFTCDYLLVAGGGAGGNWHAGGGGAGGYRYGTFSVIAGVDYTVTIGGPGAGGSSTVGTSGVASSIAAASPFATIACSGGGRGGNYGTTTPAAGGSGGGGNGNVTGQPYTVGAAGNAGGYDPVEGYAGGTGYQSHTGGGGGGAGGAGGNADNDPGDTDQKGGLGGVGLENAYRTGSNVWYASGGMGGTYYGTVAPTNTGTYPARPGGGGLGSWGGTNAGNAATSGAVNTGGGGGGNGHQGITHPMAPVTNGGSGICVIRFVI